MMHKKATTKLQTGAGGGEFLTSFQQQQQDYVSRVDVMLDKERLENKSKKWNKLDNSIRIEKLHEFASQKYLAILLGGEAGGEGGGGGGEEGAAIVEKLKLFFDDILQKKKLLKAKEVAYDPLTGEVENIPSLQYDVERGFFYLKSKDSVTNRLSSTVKSLTPKKVLAVLAEEPGAPPSSSTPL